MKYLAIILCFLIAGCYSNEPVRNMKDLDQSMMDLKIYQQNLGEYIQQGKLEDGEWLLDGLDSILQTVSMTITEHHRLKRPFSYYHSRLLEKPVEGLHKAFKKNDTALARRQYFILVDKCNKCHIDNEIDKTVEY
ncbi:MAG TPA: hypothetical protein VF145_00660 [Chitinophagaceae bacterium]